jgi:hypothetical protein
MSNERNVFKYPDTNSARAKIDFLNRKFKNQRIAIIGMGGTGSYILDLVSKTPVSEINIYDGDIFQLHNAFRAPGAVAGEKLDQQSELKKVDYYYEIYSQMHSGIVAHDKYVTKENINEFNRFNYTFISVDKNKTRHTITQELLKLNVPFIDTGLGVNMVDDFLLGAIRVTTATKAKNNHLASRFGSDEFDENDYATNIQIADLNCMNAVLAVIKWKKLCGFYQDLKGEHNTLYFINTNRIINEDFEA